MNKIIPSICLILLVSGYASAEDEWKTFKSGGFGYEISYPAGWLVRAAEKKAHSESGHASEILLDGELQKVTFFEQTTDLWMGEFEAVVFDNSEVLNLDKWIEENGTKDIFDESLVQSVADATLAGLPAKRVSSFCFDHECIELFASHGRRIYRLSFAGDNPNDNRKEYHDAIYLRMISTFAFR